jgi:hypothetical protein
MFRRKKKSHTKLTIAEVSTRIRGFIIDSQIQDGHRLAELAGCSSISPELQEHEELESDDRVDRIEDLIPILFAHAHILSEAATEYQKAQLEHSSKVPQEIWQFSRRMTEQIAFSTLVGSLSQLVDMGLIDIPKRKK